MASFPVEPSVAERREERLLDSGIVFIQRFPWGHMATNHVKQNYKRMHLNFGNWTCSCRLILIFAHLTSKTWGFILERAYHTINNMTSGTRWQINNVIWDNLVTSFWSKLKKVTSKPLSALNSSIVAADRKIKRSLGRVASWTKHSSSFFFFLTQLRI